MIVAQEVQEAVDDQMLEMVLALDVALVRPPAAPSRPPATTSPR